MIPVTITYTENIFDDVCTIEKTISLFGFVIYKFKQCFPNAKERTIGFASGDTNLTYIEDD